MTKRDMTNHQEEEIKKSVVEEIKEKILNDLNKDIKSTITSSTSKFKEGLQEEIKNDIQNEVADMMKQEEKRILKGKNFSIFKRDIVILILAGLLIYCAYCLYDVKYFDFMKSECEKNGTCYVQEGGNDPENPNKPVEVIKDTKWYIENFGYLLNYAKSNFNASETSAYYLYSGDYTISEIKSSYLLNLAYGNLDKRVIKTNSQTISVSGDDLKEAFENIFGSTAYYKAGSFTYNCLKFSYNQEKNRYTATNNKCSTGNKEIVENIDNMYEDGDVLYMITNATIYSEEESSFYSFDNLFEPIVSNVSKDDIVKNAKKLNRYQYQFKKYDDKYYLDSITKLR